MRATLIALLAANLAVTAAGLRLLPDRIAVHFDARGYADRWSSQAEHALIMTGLHVLIFSLVVAAPALSVRLPLRWVNLPNREYWLQAERRPRTCALLRRLLWRWGAVLLLLHLILGLLALRANLRRPPRLDVRLLLGATGAFLLYTAGWLVSFWRTFRAPAPPAG